VKENAISSQQGQEQPRRKQASLEIYFFQINIFYKICLKSVSLQAVSEKSMKLCFWKSCRKCVS